MSNQYKIKHPINIISKQVSRDDGPHIWFTFHDDKDLNVHKLCGKVDDITNKQKCYQTGKFDNKMLSILGLPWLVTGQWHRFTRGEAQLIWKDLKKHGFRTDVVPIAEYQEELKRQKQSQPWFANARLNKGTVNNLAKTPIPPIPQALTTTKPNNTITNLSAQSSGVHPVMTQKYTRHRVR
jgi:hypothetical protein